MSGVIDRSLSLLSRYSLRYSAVKDVDGWESYDTLGECGT